VLFVALACALVAVVFCFLWFRTSRALQTETASLDRTTSALAAAEATSAQLADDLDETTQRLSDVDAAREALVADLEISEATAAELAAARAELDETMAGLRIDLDAARAARDDAQRALEDLTSELTDTTSELEAVKATLETTEGALAEQRDELRRVTLEIESAQEALAAAEDLAAKRAETAVPPVLLANSEDGAQLDVPGFSPTTAWDLELVRSERTWRYSVATNPLEDESPFSDTQNPLRLAVEIEALALREDVGAFIGIVWEIGDMIDPVKDPARAHLTLRLAQEMLAAAAREVEPAELRVTPDPDGAGVRMQVVPMDGDDIEFNIPPPPIASEWIDIDDHGGMVVTVKTAS
jgi:hypothetical protein